MKDYHVINLSFKALSKRPVHYLLLQLPTGLIELVQFVVDTDSMNETSLQSLVLLPILFISTTLCTAATFYSIHQESMGNQLDAPSCYKALIASIKPLLIASILFGIITVFGILALVIPGLYFMTRYIFVSQIIIDEKLTSVWEAFYRSTELVKPHFWKTLGIILMVLLFGIFQFFFSHLDGHFLVEWMPWKPGQESLLISFQMGLAMILGAMIDVGVSHYYLKLRAYERSIATT